MKIIGLFFLIFLNIFANENQIFLSEKEKNFIKENPLITLGVDSTWEPYVITKNGEVVGGYEYDLIQEINKLANINLKLIPGVWNNVVEKAKSADIYGLAVSIASKERAKYFEFSNSNMIVRNNYLVREGNPKNIHSLKDLKNKTIAIQKNNGFQVKRATKIEDAKIVQFDDYKNFNEFIEKNHVDAIPMSDASLYTLNALDTPFKDVVYLEDSSQTKIVFSINKKYPELTTIINKALAYIPLDEINKLREKWLFSPIVYSDKKLQPIDLNEKEKYFLKKKPRITIGIDQKLSVKEEKIIKITEDMVNNIYKLSGLIIDFKIASTNQLFNDFKTRKIDGLITKEKICKNNKNYSCIDLYSFDNVFNYNLAIQKNYRELVSIINKSLKSIDKNIIYNIDFLNKKEKEYLLKNKNIRYCIDPNYPPFEELLGGKYVGVGADMVNIISSSLHTSFELVLTNSWKESLEFIKENKCNVLPMINKSYNDVAFLNFSDPIFQYDLAVVTRNNVSYINKIEKLKNKKIGISKDLTLFYLLKKKYPYLNIIFVESIEEGLQKVSDHKLFAVVETIPSIGNLIQKRYIGKLKISGTIEEKLLFSIGVEKEKEILLRILNKTIAEISTKTKQDIMNKWNSYIYEDNLEYIKILKIVLIVGGIIFVLFMYRQYLLKKNNQKLEIAVKEERKKNALQASKMIEQSKLAQIGELTNIIAHQWRQPLSAISATSNNLAFKLTLEEEINKEEIINEVELIGKYSQHLSKTITEFRSFFQKDKKLTCVKIEELIEKVIQIIKPEFHENNIRLETMYNENIELYTYKNELQQALLSIVQNAKDAISENNISNGKISIITKKIDNYMLIEITDNGGGIPEEIIENIFDSYITTKHKSGGTGIGLYISKVIVESHCKGKLIAQNKLDGAMFRVSLPIV